MADNLSKEQRSFTMSRIRSKWTSQERTLHNYLKGMKIKHMMHPKIDGSPDVVLKDKKVAIFLHGCFWHKCPICYVEPKTRKNYWLPKIQKNVDRDKNNKKLLRRNGFKTLILWEHEIKKNLHRSILKIRRQL